METRINYLAVGVFVLTLGAAFIAVGLWLGADIASRDQQRYSVYFDESVAGLSRNAAVTYRGVDIGRVAELRLASHNPRLVHVILEVDTGTPIRADTIAKLRMQGLTGIAQIELSGGHMHAPAPAQPAGEPYPVLTSGPSMLSRLEHVLTASMETLDGLAGQLGELLAPDHIETLGMTLSNIEQISRLLVDNREQLEHSLAHTERLLAGGAAASEQLGPTLVRAQESLAAVDRLADALADASGEFGLLVREGRVGMAEFSHGSLPQINRAVTEVHVLTDNLSRLADELAEQPEMLIFGRPRRRPGPGE